MFFSTDAPDGRTAREAIENNQPLMVRGVGSCVEAGGAASFDGESGGMRENARKKRMIVLRQRILARRSFPESGKNYAALTYSHICRMAAGEAVAGDEGQSTSDQQQGRRYRYEPILNIKNIHI